jgi:hypothetical protein
MDRIFRENFMRFYYTVAALILIGAYASGIAAAYVVRRACHAIFDNAEIAFITAISAPMILLALAYVILLFTHFRPFWSVFISILVAIFIITVCLGSMEVRGWGDRNCRGVGSDLAWEAFVGVLLFWPWAMVTAVLYISGISRSRHQGPAETPMSLPIKP